MPDAGTYWFEALNSAGENITQGIRRHREQDKQISTIDQLMTRTMGDITGRREDFLQPLIDKSHVEEWSMMSRDQKMKNAGAIETMCLSLIHFRT
jgi:hypothetical protein